MKVISVLGVSMSGKTTTVEKIISELVKRKYTVASVKEIHNEQFCLDTAGSNTDRHKQAGAQIVTARGLFETDILFPRKLSIEEILKHYNQDYVVLEGVRDCVCPKIITAHSEEEILERMDSSVFAISGRIAEKLKEFQGIPVINSILDAEKLVDMIEKKFEDELLVTTDEIY